MERPPNSVVGVIDARGMGFASVRMTGPGAGTCDAIVITPEGDVMPWGGGSRQDGVEVVAPLAPTGLGPVEVTGSSGGEFLPAGQGMVLVSGRAGPGIAAVHVVPAAHEAMAASLENGWFVAWWLVPADPADVPLTPPIVVRAYDASGTLVAETQH
jgi:hypothetical protein